MSVRREASGSGVALHQITETSFLEPRLPAASATIARQE